jgi:hypothetical protein
MTGNIDNREKIAALASQAIRRPEQAIPTFPTLKGLSAKII